MSSIKIPKINSPSSTGQIEFNVKKNCVDWLLVDLNSFFATCEQQDRPELRGKPIAVIPSMTDTTSVIAASREAKQFGIKTGTNVGEARKMCPQIQFFTGNHRRYLEYHEQIKEAVDEICPIEKVLSVDEMACQLIGQETQIENATRIAMAIKNNIRHRVGNYMTSSVGLGPNILTAKMASDLVKPDGLVVVPSEKIQAVFGPLSISIIPGVGRQMKTRLEAHGLFKVNDLLKVDPQQLRKIWGSIYGFRVAHELRGSFFKRFEGEQKSFSAEHVLAPQFRNIKSACHIALKLLNKSMHRLRRNERKCTSLDLFIKTKEQNRYFETLQFHPTDDRRQLLSYFLQLERQIQYQVKKNQAQFYSGSQTETPIKVTIVLGGLTGDDVNQMSLFADPKAEKLNQALDEIYNRFGHHAVMPAPLIELKDEVKSRIAFQQIPNLDDEL
jgi:DNA polymerase IV